MSSKEESKEAIVKKERGIVGKRSSVVRLLPEDVAGSIGKKVDSRLIPVAQPFQGVPSSLPITVAEEKQAAKEQSNPLLYPDKKMEKKSKKQKPSLAQPIVSSSSSSTVETTLKYVKKTANFQKHDRSDLLDDDTMEKLDNISSSFKRFIKQQDKLESRNPYLTSISIYTPQTSKDFYKFIEES